MMLLKMKVPFSLHKLSLIFPKANRHCEVPWQTLPGTQGCLNQRPNSHMKNHKTHLDGRPPHPLDGYENSPGTLWILSWSKLHPKLYVSNSYKLWHCYLAKSVGKQPQHRVVFRKLKKRVVGKCVNKEVLNGAGLICVPMAHGKLGVSGGMLPQEIFENGML